MKRTLCLALALSPLATLGCGHPEVRFPLRAPLWQDTDLAPVSVACHEEPTRADPRHMSCAPRVYVSSLYWDGADNLFFRPLSESFGVSVGHEAVNVNSLDEVPDSAWFQNRIGKRELTRDEVRAGGCSPEQHLDPAHAADGSWIIDQGKLEGNSNGFRIKVPGQGGYFIKMEDSETPERQAAASVIGMAVFHAAGYFAPCEQIIYVRPSLFTLMPGLHSKANFKDEVPFDRRALEYALGRAPKRNGLARVSASAWIPGKPIGPSHYKGTRDDDPNDVIPHEDRRETRAMRLLAAWIDRWDAREENSLDTWMTDGKGPRDASPGHVVHYQLDTSEALGGVWDWKTVSKRLGSSYVLDWGDIASDFVTLGVRTRPWDVAKMTAGYELFGYLNVANFDPEGWKAEYPIASFSRMTERDGAWMARILARFRPEHVRALAELGDFSNPSHTAFLEQVLQGRLLRILERYLLRLSPLTELRLEGADRLCGVDLAEWRRLHPPTRFRHVAQSRGTQLDVERVEGARVCARLPHIALDGGSAPGSLERYFTVSFTDGVAAGTLIAHVYDLGPSRGFQLVGIERPEP